MSTGRLLAYDDLVHDSLALAGRLPPDTAGIIGIARTGMIAASIIAVRLHLPLAELNAFLHDGRWMAGGSRSLGLGNRLGTAIQPGAAGSAAAAATASAGPIIVIDDSTSTRLSTIRRARQCLVNKYPAQQFLFAALWVPQSIADGTSPDANLVDFHVRTFDGREAWQEHQLLNNWQSELTMVDFDGVLCDDPPGDGDNHLAETDDEERWRKHFRTVKPLYLPRWRPLHSIVTYRMEKYRDVSEEWLRRYGCKYGRLVMSQAPSVRERAKVNAAEWKGELYRQSPCVRFIESAAWQAKVIAEVSGKPVACIEDGAIYGFGSDSRACGDNGSGSSQEGPSALVVEKLKAKPAPTPVAAPLHGKIPVYINNFNRLASTRAMVEYLLTVPNAVPIIVDNASTYPPLLEWYRECRSGRRKRRGVEIISLPENRGPRAPWSIFGDDSPLRLAAGSDCYVVTDSDLDLSGVPPDVLDHLSRGLAISRTLIKVGLSLRIDDLPNGTQLTESVRGWESRFWSDSLTDDAGHRWWKAPLDTTFAMYRAGQGWGRYTPALRADRPYAARHLPWYRSKGDPSETEEDRYYYKHCNKRWSSWSRTILAGLSYRGGA